MLLPYLRFKKNQAEAMHKAAEILVKQRSHLLTRKELMRLVNYIVVIQKENYATRGKRTKQELKAFLGLTP